MNSTSTSASAASASKCPELCWWVIGSQGSTAGVTRACTLWRHQRPIYFILILINIMISVINILLINIIIIKINIVNIIAIIVMLS